jgi:hypothetical protein
MNLRLVINTLNYLVNRERGEKERREERKRGKKERGKKERGKKERKERGEKERRKRKRGGKRDEGKSYLFVLVPRSRHGLFGTHFLFSVVDEMPVQVLCVAVRVAETERADFALQRKIVVQPRDNVSI